MIFVTKSYLPDIEEYVAYLRQIWASGHLTNHGPLVNELETKLAAYLGVKHFFYVNNGTIALQIAIKALGVTGDVLTTPFSYIATTTSLLWEQCRPVFVDINPATLTLDASLLEKALTPNTTAIMACHVYGIPCQVEAIEQFAKKHNLKVIYDAAHAFGVQYKGKGLLNYGDVSTLSFHATKLFHTVEGGGITTNDDALAHRISYMRNFGHNGPEAFYGVGINGKSSEFHAAMGLCVFPHMPAIIARRKHISELYDAQIAAANLALTRPFVAPEVAYNYAYYPVLFDTEQALLAVKERLSSYNIYSRRYFYPSLNEAGLTPEQPCPVSEDVSRRVLCLPLFPQLTDEQVKSIVQKIVA